LKTDEAGRRKVPCEKSRIACDILAYLSRHPHARDTLEGIVEWWLLEQAIRYHTKLVKEALSELVEQGLIMEMAHRDGSVRYEIAGGKKEEIKRIVRQSCPDEGPRR
jgi:hypothetical protein